jgi:phage anti-repressor protein
MSEITIKMMLDSELNIEEQKIYLNFQSLLDNDPETDYVIDLDFVFKWLGFTRRANVKRLLDKYFTINIDYIENHDKNIMMNYVTFRSLCILANTEKGKQVRKYYIKMDSIMMKYIKLQNENIIKSLQETIQKTHI